MTTSLSTAFAIAVAAAPVGDLSITNSPAGQTMVTPQGTWSFGPATSNGGNALLRDGVQIGGGFGAQLLYKVASGSTYTITKAPENRLFKLNGTTWVSQPAGTVPT